MSINPDPLKQVQEVLFSSKATQANHPNIVFYGNTVQNGANRKHVGLILDEKLTFNDHITSKLNTVNKLTSTLRKLYHYIPRDSVATVYKSFVRPHLDYAGIIYDTPRNVILYSVALAIKGTIGTFIFSISQRTYKILYSTDC